MARKLWINSHHSFGLHKSLVDPPWHYFVSIGFGHVLPHDDFTDPGLPLKTYELVSPFLRRSPLGLPENAAPARLDAPAGMVIEAGDVGPRKITFESSAEAGTYQVVVETEETFYSVWMEDGEMQVARKPLHEVREKNPLSCTKIQAFAKTFLANGVWTRPKELGHALELIPLTDLSDVHAGDWVTFQVLFMGEPFSCTQESMEFLLASSNVFGGEASGELEGCFLSSYIVNGRAAIKVPAAGQWLVNVFSRQDVSADNELRELRDSCRKVYYSSSATFTARI